MVLGVQNFNNPQINVWSYQGWQLDGNTEYEEKEVMAEDREKDKREGQKAQHIYRDPD